jgi:hypothetical protein
MIFPMGTALLFNFLHFEISDNMPTVSEVQMVVRGLKNGRTAGATRMKAGHLRSSAKRKQPGRTLAEKEQTWTSVANGGTSLS